jgi:NAD(P)-dependent dehydrogenase (short-subunit alcohol dehydrogenase family)
MMNKTAVIIGASGGIGLAFHHALAADPQFDRVIGCSRDGSMGLACDPTNPHDLDQMAERIGGPVHQIIVTTGMLHDDAQQPEKSWRALSANDLARSFAINSIAPLMVIKALLPLVPRNERTVIAALSARVGSISDNRTGGWYGYRASKAALNQLIRTLAIELSRSHPDLICVTLHPGTVDTGMSKPFQHGVIPEKLFTAEFSAKSMLAVLDGLTPLQSGRIFAWDGQEIAP